MSLREKEEIKGGLNKYNLNISFLRSSEIQDLVNQYSKIVLDIVEKKKHKNDITNEIEELNNIKKLISNGQVENIDRRNVLKGTSKKDKRIGHGQDSIVYEFKNNSKYIYKEGKEGDIENIEYLKKKYKILKKYLGELIPKSYFVLGESFSSLDENRWLKDGSYISTKSLTVQKKINGKDASKMSVEEKQNMDFLMKLEKGHKKYVLLKYFLQTQIKELGLAKKSMDLQLDLGSLSNRDNFNHNEIEFIEGKLKSPNIMWDGKDVYFIDFGYGEWDRNKEIIFEKMMNNEVFNKWEKILELYGLD